MNHKIIWWGRAVLGFGLLYILLQSISWRSLASALLQANFSWVLYAFTAGLGQIFSSAGRWQLLLKSLGSQHLPLHTLIRYYFISGFFNNFAPANLAGDAARIVFLLRHGGNGLTATTSVILERLLNLACFCALCIWALVTQPLPTSLQIDTRISQASIAGVIGIIIMLLLLWFHPPAKLRSWISLMHELANTVWKHPYELGQAIVATMILHFLTMLITYSNSQSVSIQLSLGTHLVVYAITGLALTLPISIQGIGVREGIFLGLLGTVGVAREMGLAALALNYVVLIFWSSLGAILFCIDIHQTRS